MLDVERKDPNGEEWKVKKMGVERLWQEQSSCSRVRE